MFVFSTNELAVLRAQTVLTTVFVICPLLSCLSLLINTVDYVQPASVLSTRCVCILRFFLFYITMS